MPFKSKKQKKWAFATHQSWADKWAEETPNMKNLPEKKKSKPPTRKGNRKPTKTEKSVSDALTGKKKKK